MAAHDLPLIHIWSWWLDLSRWLAALPWSRPDQVVSRSSESEEGKILAHAGARSLAVRHTRPPTSQSCHAATLLPSTTAPNVFLLTTTEPVA